MDTPPHRSAKEGRHPAQEQAARDSVGPLKASSLYLTLTNEEVIRALKEQKKESSQAQHLPRTAEGLASNKPAESKHSGTSRPLP